MVDGGGRETHYADIYESMREVEVRATTTVHQSHGGTSTNVDNSVDNSITYNINVPDEKSVEELADNLAKKLVEQQEDRRKKYIRTFKETGGSVAKASSLGIAALFTAMAALNSFGFIGATPMIPPAAGGALGVVGVTSGVEYVREMFFRELPLPINVSLQIGHIENKMTASGNEEANQSMVGNAVQLFRGVAGDNVARGRMPGYS